MVRFQELRARISDHFEFSRPELQGLLAALVLTAFIFSFRDWGQEQFDFVVGLKHFGMVLLAAALSFFGRLSCQKIYGLNAGYKVLFKVWWTGLLIALLVAFLTVGRISVILIGGFVASFIVRQRLGEFRYGFSYFENGIIALWGVLGNLLLAILFALGAFFFPGSYFFEKGLLLNIIMAICALLPLPQLDGLNIFFGSRGLYVLSIFTVILAALLLLTGTKIGLILAIVIAAVAGLIALLIASDK